LTATESIFIGQAFRCKQAAVLKKITNLQAHIQPAANANITVQLFLKKLQSLAAKITSREPALIYPISTTTKRCVDYFNSLFFSR